MYEHLHLYTFPLIPFWGMVYDWCLWMCAGPSVWIALAMAGVTTVTGANISVHTLLFVFPPPLVGWD
jgi:hypothetical protein